MYYALIMTASPQIHSIQIASRAGESTMQLAQANLLKKPDFMSTFDKRGGIRAEALESGCLIPGDLLRFSKSERN